MKYLSRYEIFEARKFPTNKEEIEKLCKYWGIYNYTIREDGTVDVNGSVDLKSMSMKKIPLKFGVVTGTFDCAQNFLKTLDGSPEKVGYFDCSRNILTDLKGGPKIVDYNFICDDCYLTSLQGAPEEVGGFYCNKNKLKNLKGGPKIVEYSFEAKNNELESLEGAPEEVGDEFNVNRNRLTNLIGSPKKIGRLFSLLNNDLYEVGLENGEFEWSNVDINKNPIIWVISVFANETLRLIWEKVESGTLLTNALPKFGITAMEQYEEMKKSAIDKFYQSLDYHYFRGGNKIDKRRLAQACEEFDITPPDTIKMYELV